MLHVATDQVQRESIHQTRGHLSYRILNGSGGIMRVGWYDDDHVFQEESQWETKEEAEQAVLLLLEYAVGGDLEAIHGLRIVPMGDA